jgi:hypothetical protein
MPDLICPYSATLQQDNIHCQHANTVIRRGGEETACNNESRHTNCKAVFEEVKRIALAEMGLEDDLLSVPHSTLVKIQFGAVLGLKQALDPQQAAADSSVPDIAELIHSSLETFLTIDQLPTDITNRVAKAYKLQRRRKR